MRKSNLPCLSFSRFRPSTVCSCLGTMEIYNSFWKHYLLFLIGICKLFIVNDNVLIVNFKFFNVFKLRSIWLIRILCLSRYWASWWIRGSNWFLTQPYNLTSNILSLFETEYRSSVNEALHQLFIKLAIVRVINYNLHTFLLFSIGFMIWVAIISHLKAITIYFGYCYVSISHQRMQNIH